MSIFDKLKTVAKTGRIPYNYTVGTPSTGKPLPFDVKISVDPVFRKTILKSVGILSAGIAIGTVTGFLLTKKR